MTELAGRGLSPQESAAVIKRLLEMQIQVVALAGRMLGVLEDHQALLAEYGERLGTQSSERRPPEYYEQLRNRFGVTPDEA